MPVKIEKIVTVRICSDVLQKDWPKLKEEMDDFTKEHFSSGKYEQLTDFIDLMYSRAIRSGV